MNAEKTIDLRKQKSQDALKQSFWRVLAQEGYHKVTVCSVADDAGLNRKTFYRNYSDLDALMNAAFFDLFKHLTTSYQHFHDQNAVSDGEFADSTLGYIRQVQAHKNLLRLIFQNQLAGRALAVWKQMYASGLSHYVPFSPEDGTLKPSDISYELLANLLSYNTFAHLEWLVLHIEEDTTCLLDKSMEMQAAFLHTYYVFYGISNYTASAS